MATAAGNPKVQKTGTMSAIPGYPSLSDQARGALKFLWRKSHVNDNWAKDGEFYYQFGLDEAWPRGWPNDWLLMCVAGGPGSWHRLYNEPNLRKFHQPTLCSVDYPTVSVAQAYYDEGLGALMVAILPGDEEKAGGNTKFKITNLAGTERKILQDEAPFGGWKAIGDGEIGNDDPQSSYFCDPAI